MPAKARRGWEQLPQGGLPSAESTEKAGPAVGLWEQHCPSQARSGQKATAYMRASAEVSWAFYSRDNFMNQNF